MLPPCDEFWDRRRRILISTIADRFEQNRSFSIERQPTSCRTMEGNRRSWEATGGYLGLPGATRAYEKCMRRFSNAFYLHETLLFFVNPFFRLGLPGATWGYLWEPEIPGFGDSSLDDTCAWTPNRVFSKSECWRSLLGILVWDLCCGSLLEILVRGLCWGSWLGIFVGDHGCYL